MFKPSMAELGLCMYQVGLLIIMAPPDILRKRLSSLDIFFIISFQLDTLIQEHIPDLYVHFQSQVFIISRIYGEDCKQKAGFVGVKNNDFQAVYTNLYLTFDDYYKYEEMNTTTSTFSGGSHEPLRK